MSKIPIHGDEDPLQLRRNILYFMNIVTDLWCHHVLTLTDREQMERSHCAAMERMDRVGFLSMFLLNVYPVIDWLHIIHLQSHRDPVTKSAMNLYMEMSHLDACFERSLDMVLEDVSFCWQIDDSSIWNSAAEDVVKRLIIVQDVGVADLYLTEFVESMMLYAVQGTSCVMPLVTALAAI